MIRTERLVQSFLELTAIDNPTLHERELSEHLRRRFAALGIVLDEDGAGAAIGGSAGNLYAYLPGDEALAPILLSAHMDAVAPACGKKPVLHPGASPPTERPFLARRISPASARFWRP